VSRIERPSLPSLRFQQLASAAGLCLVFGGAVFGGWQLAAWHEAAGGASLVSPVTLIAGLTLPSSETADFGIVLPDVQVIASEPRRMPEEAGVDEPLAAMAELLAAETKGELVADAAASEAAEVFEPELATTPVEPPTQVALPTVDPLRIAATVSDARDRSVVPPSFGWAPPTVAETAEPASPASGPGTTYVVAPGDTLRSVAARFRVPVESVRLANQLSTDNILIGQSLTVPADSELTAAAVPAGSSALQTVARPTPTSPPARRTASPAPASQPTAAARAANPTATPTPRPPAPTSRPAPPAPARSAPVATIPGGFSWPLQGTLTQTFGNGHTGVDIADPTGTAVRAVAPGIVTVAAKATTGYGWRIVVDHGNGYSSLYAHLSAFNVAAGASVARGQVIGAVGQTGLATGPHLHFEVRVNGQPSDPLKFLP
jgi:murein DD-endopeptidase MepM/ murein hydrolase activator NlpD